MAQIDGDGWRNMQHRVTKLELEHVAFKGSLDTLVSNQASQHAQNRTDIARIKTLLEGEGDSEPGIKMKLDRVMILVNTRFDDIVRIFRVAAAIIGLALAAIGLWFGILEYRHKLDAPSNPAAILHQSQRRDAGNSEAYTAANK